MNRSWILVPFIAAAVLFVLLGSNSSKSGVSIEEIQYWQGKIKKDYAELYAKVVISGDLSRKDIQMTKESFPGFEISDDHSNAYGLTVLYDVYDINKNLVISAVKDGNEEKCITIPDPIFSTPEKPVYYLLVARIRVDNRQLDKAKTVFILTKPDSPDQE